MTYCEACAAKDELIADLQAALGAGNFVSLRRASGVAYGLGLTPQQGALCQLLFDAGDQFVRGADLTDALPAPRQSIDPDLRVPSYASVLAYNVRKRLGSDFIESKHGLGYRLSPRGRDAVAPFMETK